MRCFNMSNLRSSQNSQGNLPPLTTSTITTTKPPITTHPLPSDPGPYSIDSSDERTLQVQSLKNLHDGDPFEGNFSVCVDII